MADAAPAAAPVLKGSTSDILGTGRRKTSCARVRMRPGKGIIVINGRTLEGYFPLLGQRNSVVAALMSCGKRDAVDIMIRVDGGGLTGQADACKLGIARCLKKAGEPMEKLREGDLLTRDGRMKERKKYGLRGARRGTQFSKR
jgi:small subunit ribosomal protein S9